MIWHVTFGQQYPREPHPTFGEAHRDGWVDVEADNEMEARQKIYAVLGTAWSGIYADGGQWDYYDVPFYPKGCIGVIDGGRVRTESCP